MNIEIITTCMGRLDFLQQALPTWIEHTPAYVTVVDYDCPQNSGHWATSLPDADVGRLKVIWLTASERDQGRALFNKSRAINVALDSSRADYVMLIDADTQILGPDLWRWLEPMLECDRVFIAEPTAAERELAGFLAAPRKAFAKLRFDEKMPGWAPHDIDMRVRLYLSGRPAVLTVPPGMLQALPHPDSLRTANYSLPMEDSFARGMQMLAQNAELVSGESFDSILLEPVVQRLLGHI